ncbi:MAG: phosphoribosylformylglycinamidine cyclo-ligase [Chloroflexi bacterium]|nr:phosphoribosylformylglycinamidine cyclo-ligase [Chloroflexota bacterium]
MSKYSAAGVDIQAGELAVDLMRADVQATYGPEVLAGIGAFGGLFDISRLKSLVAPVLVASTDGVGTKTKIAQALGRYDTIGQDIVHHCVNDILVQGATPLFFLDYIASSQLDPQRVAAIVSGIATACRAVGCALLGGETAEMPGVYAPGEFDLVGTIVGVVDRADLILGGATIQCGDAVLGLASAGLHTNGYSLARQALADIPWDRKVPGTVVTLGAALLAPHRCYLAEIRALARQVPSEQVPIHGLAHITGGGFIGNIPRVLPPHLAVELWPGSWIVPPIFHLIQAQGQISPAEMHQVFNMGIGMVVIVAADQVQPALRLLGPGACQIGQVVPLGNDPAVRFTSQPG